MSKKETYANGFGRVDSWVDNMSITEKFFSISIIVPSVCVKEKREIKDKNYRSKNVKNGVYIS